ncbi:MAG: glycosyl transferase [Alistipes sp.]|nr:glycosyl transferase [Alistipes sp.]
MRSRHLAYLLLLLPVFIMRDYTPSNELKYLSIVDDALRDNSWFAFYNHGVAYADKPPLFFWLMMLARAVTGRHLIWLYGLFSLLPAIGIMAVMDRWLGREKTGHDPLTSNLMLGTSVMFLGAAAVVRMDMLMCFFIVLALYTFYKLYTGSSRPRDRWLLPLWIFLAVFSKGPVGLFVPVLSITAFLLVKRDIRSFGRYLGWRQWALMLGLSAVWFLLVYADGGREYLDNLVVKQTVGRGVDAFHHKEPAWYYLANLPWMLAPWTVLYIAAFWLGLQRRLLKGDLQTLFLCTIAVTFGMLTAFSSKLQIYMLPVFPFVAYLASAYVYRTQDSFWIRFGAALPAVALVLAFPASFFADRYVSYELENLLPFRIAFFLLSAGAVVSLYFIIRKATTRGIALLGFSILLTLAVASFGLPQVNYALGYGEMARQAGATAREEGIENYAYLRFYKGQNMDVYLGRKLMTLQSAQDVAALDASGVPTILFVRDKDLTNLPGLADILRDKEAGRLHKYSWYILGR